MHMHTRVHVHGHAQVVTPPPRRPQSSSPSKCGRRRRRTRTCAASGRGSWVEGRARAWGEATAIGQGSGARRLAARVEHGDAERLLRELEVLRRCEPAVGDALPAVGVLEQ